MTLFDQPWKRAARATGRERGRRSRPVGPRSIPRQASRAAPRSAVHGRRENSTPVEKRHDFTLSLILQDGIRRGGLTPALAPCMPTITEDECKIRRKIEAVNATILRSCLKKGKENPGIRLNVLQQHFCNPAQHEEHQQQQQQYRNEHSSNSGSTMYAK